MTAVRRARQSAVKAAAEWVSIDSVREWRGNPRRNDGEPVDRVAKSIERYGWGAPIVARVGGEIIAGHTRWKAAKRLGHEQVPVRFVDVSEEEAHALALADNRLGEYAEWDDEKLSEALRALSLDDVEVVGWSREEFEKLAAASIVDDLDGSESGSGDEEFPEVNPDEELQHTCPKCGYAWS